MLDQSLRRGTLIASFASIAACDVAFGLTLQLQPLILEAAKVPAWQIGTIVSMGPLGILLAGPFLPGIIARFGTKTVAFGAVLTILATLFLFKLLPPLWWWMPLRFVMGTAIGTLFTVSEAWVLTSATNENRGRIMGVYTSMLSVTFGIGPMLLPYTGISGWLPWIICMVCVAIGIAPLAFVRVAETSKHDVKGSIFQVIKQQPLIFATVAAATIFDGIMIAFFTIFAIRRGVPMETASTILGAGIIAGVFFFYPLGILADRWSRSGVIVSCAAITVVCALLVVPAVNTIFIWPLAVLFFTTGFGVYVIALTLIGDVFKGNDIVAGSAAIAAMWGIGGLVGPPLAGRLVDMFGANAIPLTLAGVYALLCLFLSFNNWRVVRPLVAAQ